MNSANSNYRNRTLRKLTYFFHFHFQLEQNLTEKPMICCISGYCLSLALELALMCDIRFIEERAVVQFSNRPLGIPLVNGGAQRMAQLVGTSRAIDLTVTGREIKAKEAHEIGLASSIVPDGTSKKKKKHFF